jgi:dihydrofolate reductase
VGKVVVSEFVTLDGVMEAPGGGEGFQHAGWTFRFDRGPEGDQVKLDEVMQADALLLGRVTYQEFAKAWPSMTGAGAFAEGGKPTTLRLVQQMPVGSDGVLVLTYEPARDRT